MPTPPSRTTASTTSQQQTAVKGHPRPRGRAPAGKVWDTRTGAWRSDQRTSGDAVVYLATYTCRCHRTMLLAASRVLRPRPVCPLCLAERAQF